MKLRSNWRKNPKKALSRRFKESIVTEIVATSEFYRPEDYQITTAKTRSAINTIVIVAVAIGALKPFGTVAN